MQDLLHPVQHVRQKIEGRIRRGGGKDLRGKDLPQGESPTTPNQIEMD